jgi:NRAMP (natural resistance-associated macrophage protein)-like metal ion transporter
MSEKEKGEARVREDDGGNDDNDIAILSSSPHTPSSSSPSPSAAPPERKESRLKSISKVIGPGVITGASDDDPSGIATYSQAGAQFGFGMLWMVIFLYPLMYTVQEICARIGLVTGSGLMAVIKSKYRKKAFVLPIAGLLLVINVVNIGADIGAMGSSVRLIFPQVPFVAVTLAFTALILGAEIIIPYRRYVSVLKYLTLSLFAYIVTAAIVGGRLDEVVVGSLVPNVQLSADFAMMFVAVIGTTLSPYLFFWQASEEAEEDVDKGKVTEISSASETPKVSKKEIKSMKADVGIGMAFSQLIMWAIIVSTAGTLHLGGAAEIQTADQAAAALEPAVKSFPASGTIAKTIFAVGIIGTGLLAVPVLAGSCGYVLADAFGWRQGLNKKFGQARHFYLVIAAATGIGLWINFSNIDPIKALIYTAVLNGVVAVPILFAIMRISNDRKILGGRVNGKLSNLLGWAAFAVMAASVFVMFVTWSK